MNEKVTFTRRGFLRTGAFGALALAGCRCPVCGGGETKFKLAMAGYTLHTFTPEESLALCEKYGFRHLCVKRSQLPYESTPAQVSAFRRLCADHGVTPYGVGPIYMYTPDEAKRRFDYAALLGVDVISAVPGRKEGKDVRSDRAMCEVCSHLADEYKIRIAIHNHGRNPETGNPNLYPAVPEIHEMIRDLGPRMGLCVDWAYTYADGLDCVEIARTYRDRIFDGHVRCISEKRNGSSGINPAGRCFDYDGIFDALRETGYSGCLGLELANAFPKTPEWLGESRAYFEGLM